MNDTKKNPAGPYALALIIAAMMAGALYLGTIHEPDGNASTGEPAQELTHGTRFMPSVLQARAQRLYDAASAGDHETVWRMSAPESQRKCTPEGLTSAVLDGRSPSHRVATNYATVWHGHRIGVTTTTKPGGQPSNLVWGRHGQDANWQALPDCPAGHSNQAMHPGA